MKSTRQKELRELPTANDIIKKAIAELGVKENPPSSNKVKYNTEYYGRAVVGNAYPWCCAFVWWIFKHSGASDLFYGGQKTAYCPTVESYYKSKGQWHTSNPQIGDLVLFDFTGKGIAGHIGILEKINSNGTYQCIEGNTSSTSDDNGGCVMRRIRYRSQIRGFARPNYGGVATPTKPTTKGGNTVNVTLTILKKGSKGKEVETLQILLNALGYSCGKVDGDFGTNTDTALKKYQAAHKLTTDGICGQNSWNSILKNA